MLSSAVLEGIPSRTREDLLGPTCSGKHLAPGASMGSHGSTERRSRDVIGLKPYASREAFSKVSVQFDSDGTECAAWLYRPDRPRSAPVVVMGPGLAAERTFGYPALAEGLAERGVATLLFDYRRFGDSEGTPRGVVSIPKQRADWDAAIECAVQLDDVDTDRLALWGHSLGGGHAIHVAAEDRRVDAVIAHSPIVDGRAVLRSNSYLWLGRALTTGVRDRVLGAIGRPHRIPIVPPAAYGDGEHQRHQLALLPHRDAAEALAELIPMRSDWENSVRARVVLDLWGYHSAEAAEDLTVPTLLVTGADDPIVPAASVARASQRLSHGSFLALPTAHFSLFEEPWRRRLLGHAGTFLADALGE